LLFEGVIRDENNGIPMYDNILCIIVHLQKIEDVFSSRQAARGKPGGLPVFFWGTVGGRQNET
jgi:hypothetical protein